MEVIKKNVVEKKEVENGSKKYRKKNKITFDWAILTSVLFVFLYALGLYAGEKVIKQSTVFEGIIPKETLVAISLIACFFLIPYFRKIFSFYDTATPISSSKYLMDFFLKTSTRNVALCILLAWIPYQIIMFPGNLDPDTIWEILEFYGYFPKGDAHPFFDSFVFACFWKLGDFLGSNSWSLFLYAMIQMMITGYVMAVTIEYIKSFKVPTVVEKGIFVFYAFYPVIPLFSQTMAKDMIYGWIFLLFDLFYVDIVKTDGRCLDDNKTRFLYAIIMLLVTLTKKTGVYLLIIAMTIVIMFVKRKRLYLFSVTLGIVFFAFFLWPNILLPIFGVEKTSTEGMFSVASQQVSYILREKKNNLSKEEYDILDRVYNNIEEMDTVYNPVRSDASHSHWKKGCNNEDKKAFFRWYWKQYFVRPKEMILAIIAQDYPLLVVDTFSEGQESLIYYLDNIAVREDKAGIGFEPTFASWSGTDDIEGIHNILKSSYRTLLIAKISASFRTVYFHIMYIVPVLFSKVLFATWIPLIVLLYAFRVKGLKIIVSSIPGLLTTAVLAVGPIVLPRYMVSSVYICPVILALPFIMKEEQ